MPNLDRPSEVSELSEKQEAVRRFLLSRLNVCPFGRDAAEANKIDYVEVPVFGSEAVLREAANRFLNREHQVLVTIGPSDPENHEHGRMEAYQMYADLGEAFDRLRFPNIPNDQMTAKWGRVRADAALGESVPVIPGFDYNGNPEDEKFVIAMGPQFGEGHPRFAPHMMLVTTWIQDVNKAREEHPEVNLGISARMKKAFGEFGLLRGDEDKEGIDLDDHFYAVTAKTISEEDILEESLMTGKPFNAAIAKNGKLLIAR